MHRINPTTNLSRLVLMLIKTCFCKFTIIRIERITVRCPLIPETVERHACRTRRNTDLLILRILTFLVYHKSPANKRRVKLPSTYHCDCFPDVRLFHPFEPHFLLFSFPDGLPVWYPSFEHHFSVHVLGRHVAVLLPRRLIESRPIPRKRPGQSRQCHSQ